MEAASHAQEASSPAEVASITRDELKMKVGRGGAYTLVETLPPEQFQQGHLPGAINLPPDQVSTLAATLLPNKDFEIITYCASRTCHASAEAARELTRLGYTNVRHYPGGKADWKSAGLPIVK
jgi:rhodanese-related sulfurtransferase